MYVQHSSLRSVLSKSTVMLQSANSFIQDSQLKLLDFVLLIPALTMVGS